MNHERKQVIVAEIEYWRKNHLLPESYCLFLLNLYTEGDRPVQLDTSRAVLADRESDRAGVGPNGGPIRGSRQAPLSWRHLLGWMLGAGLAAGSGLLAFHFNGFPVLMQIAIITIFMIFFYFLAYMSRRRIPVLSHLSLAAAALAAAGGGLYLLYAAGLDTTFMLAFIAALCLLWCAVGLLFRHAYWLFIGLCGLGLIYGLLTVQQVSEGSRWWQMELYWCPLAVLAMGAGFLLRLRHPLPARVLAFCGLVFLFGAELALLFVPGADRGLIQLLFCLKVLAASAFFFLTRRQWFEWLRL